MSGVARPAGSGAAPHPCEMRGGRHVQGSYPGQAYRRPRTAPSKLGSFWGVAVRHPWKPQETPRPRRCRSDGFGRTSVQLKKGVRQNPAYSLCRSARLTLAWTFLGQRKIIHGPGEYLGSLGRE